MIRGINIYGSTIERGMVVKISSWSSGVPLVTICTSTDEPFGVALTDGFSNGSIKILRDGFEYFPGIIFSENDVLFVGTTDGVLDNTPGPYYLKVATVTQTDEVGSTLEVRLAEDVVAIVGSAIEGMIDTSLDYNPIGPVLSRAALTGDVSAPQGSNSTTLATVNSDVGTFGSSTQVPVITVNAKGLVTAVTNTLISFPSTTLAAVSAASTTAANSLYTMTSAVPVEFRRSGGSTLLYLNETNGRVGIGIASPSNLFHVYRNASGSNYIKIENATASTSADTVGLQLTSGSKTSYITFNATNVAIDQYVGGGSSPTLTLYANGATTGNGIVGIGNNLPTTAKLVIADTALAGSGSLAGGVLDMTQTWNTSGIPTAIKLNVTDTASNAASLLMDLQIGAVSKFKVSLSGNIITTGTARFGSHVYIDSGIIYPTFGSTTLVLNNNNISTANVFGVTVTNGTLSQTSGTNGAMTIVPIYNQVASTAANTDLLINRTETSVGSGAQLLMDLQVGGSSKFKVSNTGLGTFADDVVVPDEAYGVAWNGSLEVPTKNAVYDKIETVVSSISNPSYATKSTNYTLTSTDYTVDATASLTFTLLTSVGLTGKIFNLCNSSGGLITIDTTSSQTIYLPGGAVTSVVLNDGESLTVQSTGSNWRAL